MDFKTFKEEVKENVRAHLPKEAKDVELSMKHFLLIFQRKMLKYQLILMSYMKHIKMVRIYQNFMR